ncbi:MAG TPA: RNA polymerase factor sigma-54 [Prosthecobacter sp.]|nr:RNA polymerase factor sigma-54 [Prosthecobacter sp.]
MSTQSLTQNTELTQHLSHEMRQKLTVLHTATHELDLLVRQELQQNPVLELDGVRETPESTEAEGGEDDDDEAWDKEIEQLARLDDDWRAMPAAPQISADDEKRRQFMMESITKPVTLPEHIQGQLAGMRFDDEEKEDILRLLGYLNDNGWLAKPLEEIAREEDRPLEDLEFAQETLLSLEPAGIGAKDLRQCLMVQLEREGRRKTLEHHILDECFDLLSRRRFEDIAKHFDVEVEDVLEAAERITALNPRPARDFEESPVTGFHVQPELSIEKTDGTWKVVLHKELTPTLRISHFYKTMMAESGGKKEVRDYIRDHIKRGRFFMDLLLQRQQTIQKVAERIVARQPDFFDQGPTHLKPMTMSEIAADIGVHETTISRTVGGKFARTPHGVFELRSFFTSGMATDSGEAVSSRTVEAALKEVVAAEDHSHPLSDKEIAEALAGRGIRISRRTIVKYRDRLGILPSALRRGG